MKLKFKKIRLLFFSLIVLPGCFFFCKHYFQYYDLITYHTSVQADSLSLLNGVGQVNFLPNENHDVLIQCVVTYKGSDPYSFSEKTKHIDLTPHIENNTIYVEAMAEDLNYWQWLDENIDDSDISLNYFIRLPSYIKHLKVVNNVGDINITDLSLSLDLELSVGNIDCSNMSVLGSSNIVLKNGNLDFSADLLSNIDTVFHYVEFGDINFFADTFVDVSRMFNKVGQGNIECILPPKTSYVIDNTLLSELAFPADAEILFDDKLLSEETLSAMQRNNTLIGNHVDLGRVLVK
ncbi:MAG: hypothetical protein ATN31_05850 [Candidatus Epulonipiscioides saccharophilum]|nr:MAG: hypothetical protein ATN31_05850 [Epulopiscium sp. AS2M-Bin001]